MQTNNVQFKRWTTEEEQQLLKEIAESKPIYMIAKSHERSKKAIELRLLDIAIKMLNKGASYEDITSATKCTEAQINERINSIEEEKKSKVANQPTNSTYSPTINTINTIVQRLDILSNHIKMLDSTISKLSINKNIE